MKIKASILCASLLLALGAVAGTGCTATTTDVTDEGRAVSSLKVGPSTDTLGTGSSKQFTATLEYADGSNRDVSHGSGALWNTSDSSIATVSSVGLVQAIKVGLVTITAQFDTLKGDQQFAVTP